MLQANTRPLWRQRDHPELGGMRYCTIHSFCFWWITVYMDTKQACRESLMEKRGKKCGLLYFLLLFIQRRTGPVTPLITRWSTEEKQSTTKEEVWFMLKKNHPFSHNKSTMEAQLSVSPQHPPYSGHCGRVFQEAAGEWNDSIWLKSSGDKSDTQIISHTARLFRGTQSQSDWKDIELWTKWQLGAGWDQPGPHVAPHSPSFLWRASCTFITPQQKGNVVLPLSSQWAWGDLKSNLTSRARCVPTLNAPYPVLPLLANVQHVQVSQKKRTSYPSG